MPIYKVCDVALESDVPLPELRAAANGKPEFRFALSRAPVDTGDDCQWLHIWSLQDDTPWLMLGRRAGGYLLRFPGMADFAVSQDATEIFCWAPPDAPAETVRHLLLDQVIPLLLSRQGHLVLHSSAVSAPEGAIAFVGRTGSGKSTLAASFSAEGMPVLADDCLLLKEEGGRLMAVPSYPGVRLWPETADALFGAGRSWPDVAHYTEKKRVDGDAGIAFSARPAGLRRVYFLELPEEDRSEPEVRIQTLSARDAAIELVKFTYLIDVTDRERLQQEFERLSRVAVQPLFFRLSFPHNLERLPEVRRAVLGNVREACA